MIIPVYDYASERFFQIKIGDLFGQGGPGGLKDVSHVHNQQVEMAIWVVVHNLGYEPAVTIKVTTQGGGLVTANADVVYIDENSLKVRFTQQKSGIVLCS
jgi:hypothetical protein